MREIITHRGYPSINDLIRIETGDEPNKAGASNKYNLSLFHSNQWQKIADIKFQEGSMKDEGTSINGISNESLLAIVLDRLQSYQSGSFSCRENAIAITKLEETLMWLHSRTKERINKGIEGKLTK